MIANLSKSALILVPFLLLVGCAATPGRDAAPAPQIVAPAPVVPAPVAIAAQPSLVAAPQFAVAEAPLTPPAIELDPEDVRAARSAAQYPDLLDRLRAGFALPEQDSVKIDRELAYYVSHPAYIERVFGRAELYLHHIVGEVETRGLPLEIALLPVIESAFEPYAYSRARAAGLWQFIPGTGTRFGLKQDWWYDGRRDIVAATRAALDYLEFLHDEFNGDWLLAVAAYNCGEMNVRRAVRSNLAAGKPIDFWNLKLPAETRAYVPKLLAMSRLVAHPGDYGLEISQIANVAHFKRVDTGGQIDLKIAADLAGISTEELYGLNPAYHRWATDPSGPFFLLLPVEAADVFRQNLQLITPDQRMSVQRYSVRKGDTVASVAQKFSTTPQLVRELNGLGASDKIAIESELRVPSSNIVLPAKVMRAAALVDGRQALRPQGKLRGVHVVRRGDTLWGVARGAGMNVATLASLNGIKPGSTIKAGQRLTLKSATLDAPLRTGTAAKSAKSVNPGIGGQDTSAPRRQVTYVVRSGDTLWSIAKVLQVNVASLLDWNDLSSRSTLKPGQKLTAFVQKR
ncbi:MAG: LysM peptidoglycan-binding domain-containing protein [Steroidobacteraceae bacterium]